jgi:hypothetical protein
MARVPTGETGSGGSRLEGLSVGCRDAPAATRLGHMSELAKLRGRHLFAVDLAIIGLAIAGAMVLRFDTFSFADEALIYFPAALFPLLIRPPINVVGGLYSRAWAYASVGELVRITITVAIGSAAGIVAFYLVLVPLGVEGTVT